MEDVEIDDQDLSPAELQAFKRAVANGELNRFVDAWVPWWNLSEAGTVRLSAAGTSKVSLQEPNAGITPQCYSCTAFGILEPFLIFNAC